MPIPDTATFLAAHTPCTIVDGVGRELAERVVAGVAEIGGSAAIEESTTAQPMMVWPAVGTYEKGLFGYTPKDE